MDTRGSGHDLKPSACRRAGRGTRQLRRPIMTHRISSHSVHPACEFGPYRAPHNHWSQPVRKGDTYRTWPVASDTARTCSSDVSVGGRIPDGLDRCNRGHPSDVGVGRSSTPICCCADPRSATRCTSAQCDRLILPFAARVLQSRVSSAGAILRAPMPGPGSTRACGPGTRSHSRRMPERWPRRWRLRTCRPVHQFARRRSPCPPTAPSSLRTAGHRQFNQSRGRSGGRRLRAPAFRWRCRRTAGRRPVGALATPR